MRGHTQTSLTSRPKEGCGYVHEIMRFDETSGVESELSLPKELSPHVISSVAGSRSCQHVTKDTICFQLIPWPKPWEELSEIVPFATVGRKLIFTFLLDKAEALLPRSAQIGSLPTEAPYLTFQIPLPRAEAHGQGKCPVKGCPRWLLVSNLNSQSETKITLCV